MQAQENSLTAYLEAHGLRHVFQPGEDPSLFDAQLAAVRFPPAVRARRPTPIDLARRQTRNIARRSRSALERRLRIG